MSDPPPELPRGGSSQAPKKVMTWTVEDIHAAVTGTSGANDLEHPDQDEPVSRRKPWWHGKSPRENLLIKFTIWCIVVALVLTGLFVYFTS